MEFSPFNNVVKLCIQGMNMEDEGRPEEAYRLFLQGWEAAADNLERFLAAYYVSRHQKSASDRLQWLKKALKYALEMKDDTVNSALPSLYTKISECYNELGETAKATENAESAKKFKNNPSDKGPFYHGTKADLNIGDVLTPGGNSNYKSDFRMNHIYFTGLVNGAGLAASLAKGEAPERVYIVEPTGDYENDPNLTDKKFPGNPTRSYRSESPLKIVGEVKDWLRPAPEELQKFREKLADNKGEIIN
ncbi:NAD(+)--rifampin ADP-ribosyltransferase [Chryseobacterium flavum]|uniref:NAD(+)--rifampin ADP-ribosyltransferase n=1 Tax=Chryseobacterium flavum TaxID=415851 RepID=A0A3D9CUQ8_9FLAO|nr:NAD(+)--rifampin ADP-ribosyltransferase [Chryseobacterium flavum]REC69347.1 NAD(+)--rifampin ADP-ribosyltransferase [Chryseobacterium flavum]